MGALRRVYVLLLASAVVVLAGCAAGVTKQSTDTVGKMAPAPAAANRIVMYVSAKPPLGTGEDWVAFREEWQTSMSAAASAAGISFRLAASSSEPQPTQPATIVRVRVNDFRYVSQAKRYGVGVFSGNASMDIDAEFAEAPSGRRLGTRNYTTSSSAWQGVFSAMTPKQVEAVSKEIVNEVTGR